ncbi:hypothetical protein [Pseudomonas sp.]|uniref:hypothetical protein n=1 Tax=Pseudomonas sp. TaxID=306 RepID=UPI0025899AAA|nr:hypothetical protein [Pseudomonas sp.]
MPDVAQHTHTHFTPLILAGIALLCGLSVANVDFNQALLPVFDDALARHKARGN